MQAWGGPWYGVPLKAVQEFKYLGRLLSRKDDDWPAVHRNLSKARKSWARISCILAREGATPRVSGMFYKAVVQSVLLFGSETWVLSQPMLKALEGFHRRVAWRIAGKQPYLDRRMGEWVYPPIDKVLEEVGMYSIDHYVKKRQNTVADYVATRPIFDLCQESEWSTGSHSSRRWWDQVDRVFGIEGTSDDGE